MSKTITISDETAEILDQWIQDGQYTDPGHAVDEIIRQAALDDYDPAFVAGMEEAIRQADAGLAVPMTDERWHSMVQKGMAGERAERQ